MCGQSKHLLKIKLFLLSASSLFLCACTVMSDSLQPHGLSPSGSSLHGIFQARILKWVAVSYSRVLSNPGIEPMSLVSMAFPALVGRFFTTMPLGKTHHHCYYLGKVHYLKHGRYSANIVSFIHSPLLVLYNTYTHYLKHQYISNVCTNSLLTQAKYTQLTTENVTLN